MTAKELEKELQALDPNFSVVDNPNRIGLSNIFYGGKNYDLPTVSTNDIPLEPDPRKTYQFPNGMNPRLWSKGEIMARIQDFLKNYGKYEEAYNDKD